MQLIISTALCADDVRRSSSDIVMLLSKLDFDSLLISCLISISIAFCAVKMCELGIIAFVLLQTTERAMNLVFIGAMRFLLVLFNNAHHTPLFLHIYR